MILYLIGTLHKQCPEKDFMLPRGRAHFPRNSIDVICLFLDTIPYEIHRSGVLPIYLVADHFARPLSLVLREKGGGRWLPGMQPENIGTAPSTLTAKSHQWASSRWISPLTLNSRCSPLGLFNQMKRWIIMVGHGPSFITRFIVFSIHWQQSPV